MVVRVSGQYVLWLYLLNYIAYVITSKLLISANAYLCADEYLYSTVSLDKNYTIIQHFLPVYFEDFFEHFPVAKMYSEQLGSFIGLLTEWIVDYCLCIHPCHYIYVTYAVT